MAAQLEDPFSVLPVEACCQVLSFLPPQTIALCCLVSPQWREICNDETFWKTLYMRSMRQDGLEKYASQLQAKSGTTWKQMCLNMTLNFGESVILDKVQRQTLIEWTGAREARWVLHYRGSRDGFSLEAFHRFNDCVGPTVSVVLSQQDCVFGGYNAVSWITLHEERDESTAIKDSDNEDDENEEEKNNDPADNGAEGKTNKKKKKRKKKAEEEEDEERKATLVEQRKKRFGIPSSSEAESSDDAEESAEKRERRKAKPSSSETESSDDAEESAEKRKRRKAKREATRAMRARRAQDMKRVAEKHLPADPFIFSLRNPWDKPPTQIFARRQGDKNGVLVHGYYGALWGSGFDLGIIGHPTETPPSAWCRIGTTYGPPYPASETGGSAHNFLNGEPRDFEISELEVFVLKEEEAEWHNPPATGRLTRESLQSS